MYRYWTSLEGRQHSLDANQSYSCRDCDCVDKTSVMSGQRVTTPSSIPVRHVELKRRSNSQQHVKPRPPIDHSSQGPMPGGNGCLVTPFLTTPQSAQLCSAYSISSSQTAFSTPHGVIDQQQHPQLGTCASYDALANSDDVRLTPAAPSYPRFQTLYSLASDNSLSMLSGPAVSRNAASPAQPIPMRAGHAHLSHTPDCPQSGCESVLIPPRAPRRPQPQSPFCHDNPHVLKHAQPWQQLLGGHPHMLSALQSATSETHSRIVPQTVWNPPPAPRRPQAKNLFSPERTNNLHTSKPVQSSKQLLQKLEHQSATADTASSH